jgi:hypothetical protein
MVNNRDPCFDPQGGDAVAASIDGELVIRHVNARQSLWLPEWQRWCRLYNAKRKA